MEQKSLILCDPEKDYAQQMATFLVKDYDFPWKVIVCTGRKELEKFLEECSAEVLVLAESLAGDVLPKYPIGQMVLLNESGRIRFPEIKNIDKYQEADNVRRELLKLFAEQKETRYPIMQKNKVAECVAFYSPIRRCLQTSTAITYSQLLAERKRVLYLNFECYAYVSMLSAGEEDPDMTSLLYYIDTNKDEFALHIRTIRRSIGNWDYIVPMRNGENLPCIDVKDWLKLIDGCRALSEYDFIILDLNDGIQGLFEMLNQCNLIFTIEKSDHFAQEKMKNYEYLLNRKGYENIKQRTVKLQLPVFARISTVLEDYSRGELSDYVRRKLMMEEGHGIHGVETVSAE